MSEARTSLTLVRRIKASPIKIYEAWLDPLHLAQWWGPTSVETKILEADARVGGRYRFLMRGQDGKDYDLRGAYRELVPGERIVFTWSFIGESNQESLITVTLRPIETGTELTLTHDGGGDAPTWEGRRDGWSRTLSRLERFLG